MFKFITIYFVYGSYSRMYFSSSFGLCPLKVLLRMQRHRELKYYRFLSSLFISKWCEALYLYSTTTTPIQEGMQCVGIEKLHHRPVINGLHIACSLLALINWFMYIRIHVHRGCMCSISGWCCMLLLHPGLIPYFQLIIRNKGNIVLYTLLSV